MTTRLGLNIIGDPSPHMRLIEQMQPTTVLLMQHDSRDTLRMVKQMVEHVVYRDDPGIDWRTISPHDFVLSLPLDKLAGLGLIWQGPNEPECSTPDDAHHLSDWYVEFASEMEPRGERVIAYTFSTGNPSLAINPWLWPGWAACSFAGFHAYWTRENGYVMVQHLNDLYALIPALYRKPVIVTETGCDRAGDPKEDGYLGKPRIEPQQYAAILRGILKVLGAYVLGADIYCIGGGWPSFQVAELKDFLIAISAEQIEPTRTPPPIII